MDEYHDLTLDPVKGGRGGREEGWLFDRYAATAAVAALQAKIKMRSTLPRLGMTMTTLLTKLGMTMSPLTSK